jgi:A/G-specific adenine glycosylase
MMLQRTQAKVVEPVLKEFLERFPTVYDLNRAPQREVRRAIWRLGLHRVRSRNLKRVAKIIVEKYGGDADAALDELADLPGVGPYIAGAVACCRGRRTPAVDSTAGRVLGRLLGVDPKDPKNREALWEKARELLPRRYAREFNWALIDLAALVCRPRDPRCGECPLRDGCLTYQERIAASTLFATYKKPR